MATAHLRPLDRRMTTDAPVSHMSRSDPSRFLLLCVASDAQRSRKRLHPSSYGSLHPLACCAHCAEYRRADHRGHGHVLHAYCTDTTSESLSRTPQLNKREDHERKALGVEVRCHVEAGSSDPHTTQRLHFGFPVRILHTRMSHGKDATPKRVRL